MSERDEFLAWVGTTLRDAEVALHDGDAAPRRAIWSHDEPVTILGAMQNAVGAEQVDGLFTALEKLFSGCASYEQELVAADVVGDLAYTVAYEHTQATMNGVPSTYTLRVTQIFRREDGEWKVVHRHADRVADEG